MSGLDFVTTMKGITAATLILAAAAAPASLYAQENQECLVPPSGKMLLRASVQINKSATPQTGSGKPPTVNGSRPTNQPPTVNGSRPRTLVSPGRDGSIDRAERADQADQAAQLKATAAMLNKYKRQQGRPDHMQYVGPSRRFTASASSTAVAPPVESNVVPIPQPVITQVASASTAGLPRWGDKTCACHDAFKLYQQHRYIEAAQKYASAADNMLKAWGRPNIDIANAWRGQAVCYSAAGREVEAAGLFLKSVRTYIASGGQRQAALVTDTIADLSDSYRELGQQDRAAALAAALPKIRSLLRTNQQAALAEFNKAAM